MEKIKTILAIIAIAREVLGNKELLGAVRKLLDELEEVFDQLPGDFPDKLIDKLQSIPGIGDPTPDAPADLVGE